MDGQRHQRKHPHRLAPEAAAEPLRPVFITICASRCADLASVAVAPVLIEVLRRHAERRGVELLAYCIMPDHVHLVASIREGGGDLAGWVRYAKRECARATGRPRLWQRSYWDRSARVEDDVVTMVEYLRANPVRKGLCAEPGDWPWTWTADAVSP